MNTQNGYQGATPSSGNEGDMLMGQSRGQCLLNETCSLHCPVAGGRWRIFSTALSLCQMRFMCVMQLF